MTAAFLVEAINGFDFAAKNLAAGPSAIGVNPNVFKDIARIAAALRAAIIIFGLVSLTRCRIILRRRGRIRTLS
jgi:hypothetical protein